MILQSLCDYYDRKEDSLPSFGFVEKPISFVIVINQNGDFVMLEDTREQVNKKMIPRLFTVPQLPSTRKASLLAVESGLTAGFVWDHFGYVLGQPRLDKATKTYLERDIQLAKSQLLGFKEKIKNLNKILEDEKGIRAVIQFYENSANLEAIKDSDAWEDVIKNDGTSLAFRLTNHIDLVCQSENLITYIKQNDSESLDGYCLVSGKKAELARTHSAINIPGGTNPKVVSFNKPAFESFYKSQSLNSPVGVRASFEYTTALNYLLGPLSETKFRIADTSYVCWAEKANPPLESSFASYFSDAGDSPDATALAVKSLYSSIHNGAYQASDARDRFYVLGLAPNSARIVVRFWKIGTIAEFSEKLACWFNDLDIQGRDHYGYPALKKLLKATVLKEREDKITPSLPGDVIRSILNGTRLPETLLHSVIRRIKAEQTTKDKRGNVTFNRACSIKAFLNRKYRLSTTNQRELKVSLNKEERRIGYCLGRLFAVLEKLQLDAQPGIKATIRDRYYSSASSTPKAVFGTLLRLSTHHLKKLDNPGWRVSSERRIGEVMDLISDFPAHFNMENQGLFAIGYYHQKQDFYTKNIDKENNHEPE